MSNEKVHIEKDQVLDQLKNHYLMPGRIFIRNKNVLNMSKNNIENWGVLPIVTKKLIKNMAKPFHYTVRLIQMV